MSAVVYSIVLLPKEVGFDELKQYFYKGNSNVLRPTDKYIDLLVGECGDANLASYFKNSTVGCDKTSNGFVLTDLWDFDDCFSLLDARLISKIFKDLEIEFAEGCDGPVQDDLYFSAWKNGEIIKESLKAEECALGRILLKEEFKEGE